MRTKERDAAMLLWVDDLLNDEGFLLMSPAAKGVFVVLLCHGWREGSVPECSEHLARIARVSVEEFAQLWPEIAPKYSAHPTQAGRLVQARQERERGLAEERRRKRAEKAKKAAEARWKDRPKKGPKSTAPGSAPSDAPSIPQASSVALLGDAPQSKAKSTQPLPLPPEGGRVGSIETETQREPEAEIVKQVVDLQEALEQTAYRSNLPPLTRRGELLKQARRLQRNGLTPEDVRWLAHRETEIPSVRTRGAVLATWLDDDTWREEIDQHRSRARERDAAVRVERGADPYAGGEPKTAASVLTNVLAGVQVGGA